MSTKVWLERGFTNVSLYGPLNLDATKLASGTISLEGWDEMPGAKDFAYMGDLPTTELMSATGSSEARIKLNTKNALGADDTITISISNPVELNFSTLIIDGMRADIAGSPGGVANVAIDFRHWRKSESVKEILDAADSQAKISEKGLWSLELGFDSGVG